MRDLTLRNEFEAFVRLWGPPPSGVGDMTRTPHQKFVDDLLHLLQVQRERCVAALPKPLEDDGDLHYRSDSDIDKQTAADAILEVTP